MIQLWKRFAQWIAEGNQPKGRPMLVRPPAESYIKRLQDLEATVADFIAGRVRRLEDWANDQIAPALLQIETKLQKLEKVNMATPVEQKQALDQMTSTLEALRPVMEQFIPAVEAQTEKYRSVQRERDALRAEKERLEKERAEEFTRLEKERDHYKAEFEKANGVLAAFHQATLNATKNLAA